MSQYLTQTWGAGNSGAAMQSAIYYQGSPNLDAPTADYPQIYGSEKIEVVSGKLGAWLASGESEPWTVAGVMLRVPGAPVDGSSGGLQIAITYTADSIAQALDSAGGTSILVVLRAAGSGVTALNVFLFKAGSDFKIQIGYRIEGDAVFHSTADLTLADPVVAGQTDLWKLCWHCASDTTGYVRVYRNGTLVGSVEGIALTLKNTSGSPNDLRDVASGWEALPGGEGLAGYLGAVSVVSACAAAPTGLPVDNSAKCCGSDAVPGSGAPSPAAGVTQALPLNPNWTPREIGGGEVATAADVPPGEDWSDA